MIVVDDYAIEYYPGRNQIVIALPQTADNTTAVNTRAGDSRVRFSAEELLAILMGVKAVAEGEFDEDA